MSWDLSCYVSVFGYIQVLLCFLWGKCVVIFHVTDILKHVSNPFNLWWLSKMWKLRRKCLMFSVNNFSAYPIWRSISLYCGLCAVYNFVSFSYLEGSVDWTGWMPVCLNVSFDCQSPFLGVLGPSSQQLTWKWTGDSGSELVLVISAYTHTHIDCNKLVQASVC